MLVACSATPLCGLPPPTTRVDAARSLACLCRSSQSPDRSNPVAHALLTRANGSVVSSAVGLPLTLASSDSFQQDLSQLLCARHLAVASSSLNDMLLHSPNLRDVYEFNDRPCDVSKAIPCVPATAVGSGNGGNASSIRANDPLQPSRARAFRRWCVSANASAGTYSVTARWANTPAQQQEMLVFGSGIMRPPVQTGGPPLPCAA